MTKVLIEVTSPAAGETFDMFVPETMHIGEVALLVSGLFDNISQGTYKKTNSPILCEKISGSVYDPNKTVKESGILNGTKFLLF